MIRHSLIGFSVDQLASRAISYWQLRVSGATEITTMDEFTPRPKAAIQRATRLELSPRDVRMSAIGT